MSKEINIRHKLGVIQAGLKSPKGQTNEFGGFKFRSAEDILAAVKPLLVETKTILVVQSKPTIVGDRHYIKTVAELIDTESDDKVSAIASAMEQESKKGMDTAQVSGSTLSYSKKYALGNLFAIDNEKDADSLKPADQEKKAPVATKITLMEKMEGSILVANDSKELSKVSKWISENQKSFKEKELEDLQILVDEKKERFAK